MCCWKGWNLAELLKSARVRKDEKKVFLLISMRQEMKENDETLNVCENTAFMWWLSWVVWIDYGPGLPAQETTLHSLLHSAHRPSYNRWGFPFDLFTLDQNDTQMSEPLPPHVQKYLDLCSCVVLCRLCAVNCAAGAEAVSSSSPTNAAPLQIQISSISFTHTHLYAF